MSHFKDPIQRRNFLGTLLASASVGVAGLALPLQIGAAEERALPAPGAPNSSHGLAKSKENTSRSLIAPLRTWDSLSPGHAFF